MRKQSAHSSPNHTGLTHIGLGRPADLPECNSMGSAKGSNASSSDFSEPPHRSSDAKGASGSKEMAIQVVKVATAEQLREYMRIRCCVFVKGQGVTREEEVDEYDGGGTDPEEAGRAAVHLLAMVGGVAAGTGRLLLPPGEVCKAGRIATLPQFRRMGVGRAVMLAIHAAARERGYARCQLGAQLPAVPFYLSLGYRVTPPGDVFMDARMPHKMMDIKL